MTRPICYIKTIMEECFRRTRAQLEFILRYCLSAFLH